MSCRSIENCGSSARMTATAPAFTTSDVILLTRASSAGSASRCTYSRQMLRENRFAAAIAMIAAGTSAPIAIAAKATPANQSGNI